MSVEYEREKEVKLGARWHMWQKDHWPGVESMFAHSVKGMYMSGVEETSVQVPLMQLRAV